MNESPASIAVQNQRRHGIASGTSDETGALRLRYIVQLLEQRHCGRVSPGKADGHVWAMAA